MKLKIEINIDDHAFLYDDALAKVLHEVGIMAMKVEGESKPRRIEVPFGHIVGKWEIKS